ncbi:MAG: VCBS repeat-containing protein [candidate division Zixibacteria bacterium]|nr:VCBS repeat-containing protein [candidate division Zixibacteria bacterium]
MSDFNNDGIDDLVTLSDSGGVSIAFIMINDGNGNFTVSDSLHLGALTLSTSTNNSLADFNNDGNPDFALISPLIGTTCASGSFLSLGTIGLGDGNGGILGTENFEVCGTSYNMTTADVNRDNELDIVVANGSTKGLTVLLGNGDGTFQLPVEVALGAKEITFVLAQGDYNRDGNPDFSSGGALVRHDSIYSALNKQPGSPVLEEEMVTTAYSSVAFYVRNPEGYKISRLKNTVAGGRYERLDENNDGQLDAQTYDYNLQYGDYTLVFRRRDDIISPATFDANIRIGDSRHLRIFKDYDTPGTTKGSVANDSIVFRISIDEFPQTVPESGEMEFDNTPNFSWGGLALNKFGSAISYDFQLDSKVDFSAPLISETGLTSTSYTTSTLLTRDFVYYWRVRGFDGAVYSDWSNALAVYIGPFFCGDCNNDNSGPNVLDLTFLVDFIFRGGPPAECPEEADVNNDGSPSSILDLTYLVDFIFRGGQTPVPC